MNSQEYAQRVMKTHFWCKKHNISIETRTKMAELFQRMQYIIDCTKSPESICRLLYTQVMRGGI